LVVLAPRATAETAVLRADWPQWRGPAQTGCVAAGVPMPSALPAEPKVVWRAKIGDGYASPVVAKGSVFYLDNQGGNETVHAAEAATGKELWSATLDACFKDNFVSGPRCTPLADADRVYAQSCRGEFQCLSMADGKVIWKKNFTTDFGAVFIGEKGAATGASRHGNAGPPVIDGDNIIVGVGGTKGACLVCMKKATGDVVWQSQNDQTAYGPVLLTTLCGVKQAIAFTVEGLIGVDPAKGSLLWRSPPMKTAFGRHITTPVVADDTVLVASHTLGLIATRIAKDAKDGAATAETAVLRAETAWTEKAMGINFSSPVLVGQHLYGLGPAKNIVCIDVRTGKLAWDKKGCVMTDPGKAHAAFIVMDKNILMLTDAGQLILFAADPKEYKEIGRAQVCGQTWCNPAYVDGRLYLRDAKELLCVELLK
ncbi:MAG: PQQ-like beta-propeller repeat protein, partial [Planctomycetota bacterium]|nr:PQQ-like beta-propeller repeat protein [Planctomycetota bacterium]